MVAHGPIAHHILRPCCVSCVKQKTASRLLHNDEIYPLIASLPRVTPCSYYTSLSPNYFYVTFGLKVT